MADYKSAQAFRTDCKSLRTLAYFVKGLIGKVLAYGGLQIRTGLSQGLQILADIKDDYLCKKKNIKNIAL